MRLGKGEYDGGGMATWESRCLLLDAIQEKAPQVLQDLKEILPEINEDQLQGWADKYNLNYPWVIELARDTLQLWKDFPELTEQPLEWPFSPTAGYWLPASRDEMRLSFTHPGGDIAEEPRNKLKKRILADFEASLDKHLDSLEIMAQERGLEKTPELRKKEHFFWLVSYQVEGLCMRAIADYYSEDGDLLTEDTISKGIRKAADITGITLRPAAKGGRPRK